MTVRQLASALRTRKASSAELVRTALDTAHQRQHDLNAFITLIGEKALQRAADLDAELAAGHDRGPLHGIPIAVKDNFWTKGIPSTSGSKIFRDFIPSNDAAVVERLEQAGAVIIGKTNLHECAYGISSTNPHFGAVHNPHRLDRIPGGSSGGSGAAVAAGIVPIGMGTDTGGSIRIPASYCGTFGIKPTYGRVSRYGCQALAQSLDHMGPLTRTPDDAAIVLQAISGFDPRDESSSRRAVPDFTPGNSIHCLRIGVPENFYFEHVDEQIVSAVHRAADQARSLGAHCIPVRVPDIAEFNVSALFIQFPEASAVFSHVLHRREDFGADVLARLDQGRLVSGMDYVNAQRLRRIKIQEFRTLFRNIDVLITPSTPITAPVIGQTTISIHGFQEDARIASTRFARAINALGWPAASFPYGKDVEGLPIGVQIIARPWEESVLLTLGAALQSP